MDAKKLLAMIDNNVETLGNVAFHADEKSLPGISNLLRKVADTLSHCRAAIHSDAAQAPWISVADRMPASGRTVLATYLNSTGKSRRIRAQYIAAKTRESNGEDGDLEFEYDEGADTYYWPAGWYECVTHLMVSEGDITHWADMPPAPGEPYAAPVAPAPTVAADAAAPSEDRAAFNDFCDHYIDVSDDVDRDWLFGIAMKWSGREAMPRASLTAAQSAAIDAVCSKLTPTQAIDLGGHIQELRSVQWQARATTQQASKGDERAAWQKVLSFSKGIIDRLDTSEVMNSTVSGTAYDAAERAVFIRNLATEALNSARAPAPQAVTLSDEPAAWINYNALTGERTVSFTQESELASTALYGASVVHQAGTPSHTYASTQATDCARCGECKHTPLRIDWMGGYVCLTCIDRELEANDPSSHTEQRMSDAEDAARYREAERLAKCVQMYAHGWPVWAVQVRGASFGEALDRSISLDAARKGDSQ